MVNSDLLTVLPAHIKSGSKLYSYSENKSDPTLPDLTSTEIFHRKCDNEGPTLMIVKTNTGHIFGGYNPTSWVSQFTYTGAKDAFVFSLTDGKGRPPYKCGLRAHKKEKAIKQTEG